MFNNKRIMHISHTDLDGYGCQLIFKELLKHNVKDFYYKGINIDYHEDIFEFVDNYQYEYDILVISDLNISDEILNKIQDRKYEKIIYIDHHLRKENDEYVFDGAVRNQGKIEYIGSYFNSATYLTYNYLKNKFGDNDNELNRIANIIDTYDMWRINNVKDFLLSCSLSDVVYYLNGVYSEFKKTQRFEKIIKILELIYPYYTHNNKCGISMILKKIYGKPLYDKLEHMANDLEIFGEQLINYPVANGLLHALKRIENIDCEIVGKIAIIKNKKDILQYGYMKIIEKFGVNVVLNVNELEDGNLSVSARSYNGEAIKICKKIGGGGHSNACGSVIKNMNYDGFKKMLNEICENDK